MSKIYIDGLLDIIQYLLEHRNTWFSEENLYKLSPRYGKKIVDNLIDEEIIVSTKDGILFDESDIIALNSYMSEIQDDLQNIKKSEQTELLNKMVAITNIIASLTNIFK